MDAQQCEQVCGGSGTQKPARTLLRTSSKQSPNTASDSKPSSLTRLASKSSFWCPLTPRHSWRMVSALSLALNSAPSSAEILSAGCCFTTRTCSSQEVYICRKGGAHTCLPACLPA